MEVKDKIEMLTGLCKALRHDYGSCYAFGTMLAVVKMGMVDEVCEALEAHPEFQAIGHVIIAYRDALKALQ